MNDTDAPCQTASNTILFEMMNFYKRRCEIFEAENQALKKKMRMDYENHRNEMGDMQQRLHDEIQSNSMLAQVNLQGAHTIIRKHNAGLRLAHCIDSMAAAIELIEDTHVGDEALGLRYISMEKDKIMEQANVAIMMLTRRGPNEGQQEPQDDLERWENEIADNMLVIERQVIDLTEETEEEEELSGEETETDEEN